MSLEPMPLPPSAGGTSVWDEGDDAVGNTVIGRGNMAVEGEFVTVMRRVVGNRVVHIIQSVGACWLFASLGSPVRALFPTCCRLQNCIEWVLREAMPSPVFV
jgi:hypothetical protein